MAHVHTGNMFLDREKLPRRAEDSGWMDVETYARLRRPGALQEYLKRKREEQKELMESIEMGLKMLIEEDEELQFVG